MERPVATIRVTDLAIQLGSSRLITSIMSDAFFNVRCVVPAANLSVEHLVMHLVYIDEVKHDPPVQQHHWLCALAFAEAAVQSIDSALSTIAEEFFGTPLLTPSSEFHAKHIVHGKGPYKGRPTGERVTLYKALLDVIAESDGIGRIEIRIDPSRMIGSRYKDMAFMFLVEKVEDYMRQSKSIALLIADEDKELASTNVVSLSAYKARGTDYAFGKPIRRVVDTIHHTRSHQSRLLQLADLYVYTLAMVSSGFDTYPRKELAAYARGKSNLLFPTKYKNWPTDHSWYKTAR